MREPAPQFVDLLLLDDILPLDFSPFRTLEYAHYLEFFDAALLSLEGWHVHLANETFAQALAALPIDPAHKTRVRRFNEGHGITGRLAYVTFLHNAATLLPYFTQRIFHSSCSSTPAAGSISNSPAPTRSCARFCCHRFAERSS